MRLSWPISDIKIYLIPSNVGRQSDQRNIIKAKGSEILELCESIWKSAKNNQVLLTPCALISTYKNIILSDRHLFLNHLTPKIAKNQNSRKNPKLHFVKYCKTKWYHAKVLLKIAKVLFEWLLHYWCDFLTTCHKMNYNPIWYFLPH